MEYKELIQGSTVKDVDGNCYTTVKFNDVFVWCNDRTKREDEHCFQKWELTLLEGTYENYQEYKIK